MQLLTVIVCCTLVVTNAQLLPGFSFGSSGFGGFSLSNPLFNASFTPANPLGGISSIASRIRDLASNVQQNIPRLPQLANPLSAFSRFTRPSSISSSASASANQNNNHNSNSNSVNGDVRSANNEVPRLPVFPRIPGLPQLPEIPRGSSFSGSANSNSNQISRGIPATKNAIHEVINNIPGLSALPRIPNIPGLPVIPGFSGSSGLSGSSNSNVSPRSDGNSGIDGESHALNDTINRIPGLSGLPGISEIPGLRNLINPGELTGSFISSLNNIIQQGGNNPSQIFNQINKFLPDISRIADNIANFANSAANSGIWSNISSDIKNEMQHRLESVTQRLLNITSAVKNIAQSFPNLIHKQSLNTTLRNEPFFFPGRSGIVHLFEWKFSDIAEECEKVLGPNGYGGVQVSPINEYLVSPSRAWWERYQPISYEIKSRSGNEKQFSDMVKRCLKSGIRIYVDVVMNHMAAPGASSPLYGTAGSTCDPADRDYPAVPYNQSHFHADCDINNYNNATNVRDCKLVSLPDLDQSNSFVREKIVEYLNHLLDLGVAGFRMDACKHMWPADLEAIYDSLKPVNQMFLFPPGARPFIYQEVIDLGQEAVSANEYTNLGVVTDFGWCLVVGDIFRGTLSADALEMLTTNGSSGALFPSSQALVFVDNHDNQRGHGAGGASILNYKTKPQYIQAVSFTLATDYGIPRVMSSYDFTNSDQGPPQDAVQDIKSPGFAANGSCTNGWICEHRWPEIKRMIHFRNFVAGSSLDHIQSTKETFAFCRGEKGFIVFNNSANTITQVYHTCLPEGQYCDIISGELAQAACTGKVINVDANGDAEITLEKNSVVAVYLPSKLP